ncbi:hypothetical protein OCH7691_03189 [Oceanibacterium hippocampi]|uniref:Glycosyltransferase RgtA/B/C/D-like domain-containing protein n=2 Tax=Oceanibacterium hippocampi TaxID=745714 RepID=A0A1Y5TQV4_9PROT|nr:hypothetical protein OCH7691_03189 [Oceanibacterium hippocampi]
MADSMVPRWLTILIFVLLAIALAVGLYARLAGFGGRSLAVDEYYFVSSVDNLLARGLPEFATGGYYLRGITLQYVTAASALLFGGGGVGDSAAYRLPVLLFGLGAIILNVFYLRRFARWHLIAAVTIALLVSSWQVEFDRFLRMYSALQFVTLVFFITLHRSLTGPAATQGGPARYLPHLAAVLAVLTHSLALFLVPFLFLGLLLPDYRPRLGGLAARVRYGLAGTAVLIFSLALSRTDSRAIGVAEARFPEGFVSPLVNDGPLWLPELPFFHLATSPLMHLAVVLGAVGVVGLVLALLARRLRGIGIADFYVVALILFTAAHLFLPAALIAMILFFRYQVHRVADQPTRRLAGIALAILIAIGWLIYATLDQGWLSAFGADAGPVRGFRLAFFGWPNLYRSVLLPWSLELPWLGLLAFFSIFYILATLARRPLGEIALHPAMVALYTLMCFGVFNTLYPTTRYAYFIYPFLLTAIVLTIDDVAGRLAPRQLRAALSVAVFLGLFAIAGDFHPRHLMATASADVTYRSGPFAPYAATWYPRRDAAGAARYALETVPADAPVVVVDLLPASHYLRREHAVYLFREDEEFYNNSRRGGTVDLWANRPLLSEPGALCRYAGAAGEIWLLIEPDTAKARQLLEAAFGARQTARETVFTGHGGSTAVVRVTLGPGACPP